MMTMDDALARYYEGWADAQFPGERLTQAAKHLVKEAAELLEEPSSIEEIGDVMALAYFILRRAGHSPADLAAEIDRKTEINRARIWAEGSDGVIEHVR